MRHLSGAPGLATGTMYYCIRDRERWIEFRECAFAALRTFVLNGTDHRSHGEQDDAIAACIRWRDQHVQPR